MFQQHKELHFSAVARKVLDGRYTFAPFLEKEIPKPESKDTRTISICSIRDCIVQRLLYRYLYDAIDIRLAPAVFGYRKGKKAHGAIRLIQSHFRRGMIFVYDADISKFFDTVNHDILMGMIDQLGIDHRARRLVLRFLKTDRIPSSAARLHKTESGKQRKYDTIVRDKGVPQGGVLSGMLANLYLAAFDSAIIGKHPGFVRYADDFLVCCTAEAECREVGALVVSELEKLRLVLNKDKTFQCVSAEKGVGFLGFQMSTNKVRIRGRNVARFKQRVTRVIQTQVFTAPASVAVKKLCRRLRYKIRGPDEEQLVRAAANGPLAARCRRSWIGYFRIVDDYNQLRTLDRWLRRQVSGFAWRHFRFRVTLRMMQEFRLPSLMNSLWKAKKGKQPYAEYDG